MNCTIISYLDGAICRSVAIRGTRSASEIERLQEYFMNDPRGALKMLETVEHKWLQAQPPAQAQMPSRIQTHAHVHRHTQATIHTREQPYRHAQVATFIPLQAHSNGPVHREYWDGKRYGMKIASDLRLEEVKYLRDSGCDQILDSPEVTSVLRTMEIPIYITKGVMTVTPMHSLRDLHGELVAIPTTDGKQRRADSPMALRRMPMPMPTFTSEGIKPAGPWGTIGDGQGRHVGDSIVRKEWAESLHARSARELAQSLQPLPDLCLESLGSRPLPGLGPTWPVSSVAEGGTEATPSSPAESQESGDVPPSRPEWILRIPSAKKKGSASELLRRRRRPRRRA